MGKTQNRREFIQAFTRGLVLSGLIAGTGYLVLRPGSKDTCHYDFVCEKCKKLSSCKLPEAKRQKAKDKKKQ